MLTTRESWLWRAADTELVALDSRAPNGSPLRSQSRVASSGERRAGLFAVIDSSLALAA